MPPLEVATQAAASSGEKVLSLPPKVAMIFEATLAVIFSESSVSPTRAAS
jgi:hypothetical protein